MSASHLPGRNLAFRLCMMASISTTAAGPSSGGGSPRPSSGTVNPSVLYARRHDPHGSVQQDGPRYLQASCSWWTSSVSRSSRRAQGTGRGLPRATGARRPPIPDRSFRVGLALVTSLPLSLVCPGVRHASLSLRCGGLRGVHPFVIPVMPCPDTQAHHREQYESNEQDACAGFDKRVRWRVSIERDEPVQDLRSCRHPGRVGYHDVAI
jgi:hypothetical protein